MGTVKTITVVKKEDKDGVIVVDVNEVKTITHSIKYTRIGIIDRIAMLTQELATLEKLLVDVDAKQLSIETI